jgi:hypothetical protein
MSALRVQVESEGSSSRVVAREIAWPKAAAGHTRGGKGGPRVR